VVKKETSFERRLFVILRSLFSLYHLSSLYYLYHLYHLSSLYYLYHLYPIAHISPLSSVFCSLYSLRMPSPLSYAAAGVDIDAKEDVLAAMETMLASADRRVLTSLSAFATLYDGKFPRMKHPVLVLKTEEPGSKQLLAFQHDRIESVCEDMINHLINDIAVMGAVPLAVQDAVICGKLEKKIIKRIVAGCADACRKQKCVLTGGETSEQPGVIPAGTYILCANVVGVVEKKLIIDGKRIQPGDVILSVASNGLHTNGYSLVRTLLQKQPALAKRRVGGRSFIDAILLPHVCYLKAIQAVATDRGVHGIAHITGSGIAGNLERVLPGNTDARIDCSLLRPLPVFGVIKEQAGIDDAEMLRTYNCGTGLTVVVEASAAKRIAAAFRKRGHDCSFIGTITKGKGRVQYTGEVPWKS
jgi:phosphoribosylformylglycinamidine cyclo-ligase